MTIYTEAEVQQQLKAVLDGARSQGEVRIRMEGGEEFIVRPVGRGRSPLDVRGVDLGLTSDDILRVVRESRE